jgi:hypothetical protein
MKQDILEVFIKGSLGGVFLWGGIHQAKTFLERRRWPVVEATLESVDGQIEVTSTGEAVGIQPRYIHELHYMFRGVPHCVKLAENRIVTRQLRLRVNPDNPAEAHFEDKRWIFPVLGISIGVGFIVALIAGEV